MQMQEKTDWGKAVPEEAFSEARRRIRAAKANDEEELTLADLTTLSVLPPDISDFSKLRKLVLHDLSVTELSALAGLPSLRVLRLSHLPVSDITPIAGLRSLISLSLGRGIHVKPPAILRQWNVEQLAIGRRLLVRERQTT